MEHSYLCVIHFPNDNEKTINLNISNETSIQQIKNQIQQNDQNIGSNFLLSTSDTDNSQILKSVGWTKLLSIEPLVKQLHLNKPNERKLIRLFIILPNSLSGSGSLSPPPQTYQQQRSPNFSFPTSPSSFSSSPSPSSSALKFPSNNNNNSSNSINKTQSTKSIIASFNSCALKSPTTTKPNNNNNNGIIGDNNNNTSQRTRIQNQIAAGLRKSKSDIRLENYWKSADDTSNNNSNNNNNSNSNTVLPNMPGQIIYQPSTFTNNNSGKATLSFQPKQQQQQQPPKQNIQPSITVSPPSQAQQMYQQYIPPPSPTNIDPINVAPSTINKPNKFENLDLNLLDEMLEQIPSINNQQTKAQKKRSTSFSSHFPSTLFNITSPTSTTLKNNNNNYYNGGNNLLQVQPQQPTQPIEEIVRPRGVSVSSNYSGGGGFSKFFSTSLKESPIIHSGEMYKKNRNLVGWKKRYFILTSNKLIYSNSSSELPKSELNISDYILNITSDSKYFCIQLTPNTTNGGKSYLFGIEDMEYHKEWIIAFNNSFKCLDYTKPIDLLSYSNVVPLITMINNDKKLYQTLEIDYHKKLPSETRVSYQNDEINYFRFKMNRLSNLIQPYTFKSNNLLSIDLTLTSINYDLTSSSGSGSGKNSTSNSSSSSSSSSSSTMITNNKSTNNNNNNNVIIENIKVISKPTASNTTSTNNNNTTLSSSQIINDKFIKVLIYHNGLVIKYLVNINSTFEMILNERIDLFGGSSATINKYALKVKGSMEHIFNLKIQLKHTSIVEKCTRFRKKLRLTTIDNSLQKHCFIPNTMNTFEWKQFQEKINLNQDEIQPSNNSNSSKNIFLIDLHNNKPNSFPKTLIESKLVITIVNVENIVPILKRYYPSNYQKIPVYLEIQIFYGDLLLGKNKTTSKVNILDWNEQLYFDLNLIDFPKECTFLTSIYSNESTGGSGRPPLLLAQYPHQFLSLFNKKFLKDNFIVNLLPIFQQPIININGSSSNSSGGSGNNNIGGGINQNTSNNSNNSGNNNNGSFLLQQQQQHHSSIQVLSGQNIVVNCKIPNITNSIYFQEYSSSSTSNSPNITSTNSPSVVITTQNINHNPISYRKQTISNSNSNDSSSLSSSLSSFVENLIKFDKSSVKESDRSVLWENRVYCKLNYPNILPTLLYNYSILSVYSRVELYQLLWDWPIISPEYGIELLGSDFIDDKIREIGVISINQWTDNQLSLYLPQVVSMLKFESNNYSPLVNFIVKRSICNPLKIGQPVFWLCSNEISQTESGNKNHIIIRFKLVMEIILHGLGIGVLVNNNNVGNNGGIIVESNSNKFGQSLLYQYLLIQLLKQINIDIIKEPEKQKQIFESRLASIPKVFTLPTHPFQEFNGFILQELKVKDSNAAPLWLVFSSIDSDSDDTKIIFKKDDVRPDELCLQLFSVMDNLLKSHGLDCEFTIFKCMSFNTGLGLIEVVPDSVTLADFMRDPIKYPSIEQWLKLKNQDSPTNLSLIYEIFLKSCSAYCVATYLLGIYDRHNDNLMVSETSHFFHIDFGYFLGRVTKFMWFERETAPFVLTKDIVSMIGSRENEFNELCCKIYNILRNHSRQLLNLIPTISGKQLVQDRLKLDLTNDKADKYFLQLIKESKQNYRSELNNIVHVLVHPK